MTWVLAACQSLLSRDSREMESCDQRGGHIPTGPTGKRLALCPQDHLLRVTMGLDDPTTGRHHRDLSADCVLGPWSRGLEL